MGLREQYRPSARRDAGYAMAGLLVAIAVMGIAMSMLMPTWRTWAKREKEAELIFRGEQYMRAIELYQRQFAGAYPADMKMLVDQRFLRKLYTDPMTNDGMFEVLTQASVRAAPGQAAPVTGMPALGQQQQFSGVTRVDQDTSSPTPFSRAARESNEGAGGIIGVVSSSTDSSMALYGGRDRYDEWLFVYLPQAAQPGLGTGVPGQGGTVESTIQDRILFGDPGGGARGRGGRGGRGGQGADRGGQRPGAGAPRGPGPSGQGLGAPPRR